jgi:2-polyprenyl-6-methoxyphenol hydroxylase-like FAD-dependent oxidoreductase
MAVTRTFDVIVVGGGIAGSTFAGVLARSGLGVLVVEKEARFRDRVRGEGTVPYGVAEAMRLGLADLLTEAGCIELPFVQRYYNQALAWTYEWAKDSIDGLPALTYSHPRFQEAAFTWAGTQGATLIRPAKAIGVAHGGRPCLTVLRDGQESEYSARLIVGADGKLSAARSWFGSQTVADAETHKFGGVLVSGVRTNDREADNIGDPPGPDPSAPPVQGPVDVRVNWFAISADMTRLYLHGRTERLRELGIDRSFEALRAAAARAMPEGAMDAARSEGPIGFFPNNNIWASKVAGDDMVLIGDAAGAPDPSRMGGTALLFRDVRELSELLLADRDWQSAIAEFAVRRTRYYEVIRESDRWEVQLKYGVGEAADRAREGNRRAKQADPTLGGIALIEAKGPDGLVADDAARRIYFGENLA